MLTSASEDGGDNDRSADVEMPLRYADLAPGHLGAEITKTDRRGQIPSPAAQEPALAEEASQTRS